MAALTCRPCHLSHAPGSLPFSSSNSSRLSSMPSSDSFSGPFAVRGQCRHLIPRPTPSRRGRGQAILPIIVQAQSVELGGDLITGTVWPNTYLARIPCTCCCNKSGTPTGLAYERGVKIDRVKRQQLGHQQDTHTIADTIGLLRSMVPIKTPIRRPVGAALAVTV